MTKVLIIANDESTIVNFRLEILETFIREGFDVTVAYPLAKRTSLVEQTGAKVRDIAVSRHGQNIAQDIKFFNDCKKLITEIKPDVVLTYTIKPNIYASIASQKMHVPYINTITGIGSVVSSKSFLSKILLKMQKYAYRKSSCVFFQNQDNLEKFRELNVISQETNAILVPGSGVNLDKQKYEEFPPNDGITRFIIVSRLRSDKGYNEFFDMAEAIKAKYPNTEFNVVGWYEEPELSVRVDALNEAEIIKYHGEKTQAEVHELIKQCNCLMHPSYHEGMANVILEAASTGRPVIVSNIPGCKEGVDAGETGLLCEVKDSQSLINAVEEYLSIPYEKQVEMGLKARQKMQNEFDREFVAKEYIKQIKLAEKR